LHMKLPETAVDLAQVRRQYHAAEVGAKAS
jgi:hypothetical protein